MKLIADSGSTKTDWRLIKGSAIQQFSSQGLNPMFANSSTIADTIQSTFVELDFSLITGIYFYGAGCSSFENAQVLVDSFKAKFVEAKIEVQSDIVAAARATSNKENALVGILGTGANLAHYNGKEITQTRSGLGYILGDEGSGAHLGKAFIQALLNQQLTKDIEHRFKLKFNLSKGQIIDQVYRQPSPNLFLSKFSKYVFQLKEEPCIAQLIVECFKSFFEKHVVPLSKETTTTNLHLVGSVAFYYSNFIRRLAPEYNIQIGTILEKPIAGLTLYHSNDIK